MLVSSLFIHLLYVGWWSWRDWPLHQNFKCTKNCGSWKYVPAWPPSPIHLHRGKGCCRSTHRNKFIFSGDYCNIIAGMLLHVQHGVSWPKEYVHILRNIDVKKSWCFKIWVTILKLLNSLNHWKYIFIFVFSIVFITNISYAMHNYFMFLHVFTFFNK